MAIAEISPALIEERHFVRASFAGSAREYFGIWIVNVLLTIITLGIYSAWAKVRRNRYFYGNTVLLGHAFEYHAKPKQILIGRLIVFGFLAANQVFAHLHPLAAIAFALVIVAALPFMFVRALRFNARVTSYRNVRFDFLGNVRGAFAVLYLGGLMAAVSLGLLLPFATRWYYRYVFDNLRYGDKKFSTNPPLKALYGALGIAVLFLIIGFVAVFVLAFGISSSTGYARGALSGLITLIALAPYLLAAMLYRATVHNVIWSSTVIDGRHDLWSDIRRGQFVFIAISNIVLTILTFGLLRPWAAVRQARYVIEHTAIRIDGDMGLVFDQIRSGGNAIAAEYLDADGFDFGF